MLTSTKYCKTSVLMQGEYHVHLSWSGLVPVAAHQRTIHWMIMDSLKDLSELSEPRVVGDD